MVVALGVLHPWPGDAEDGDPPPVRSTHLDGLELAAADEAQRSEEEIVRLDHVCLPVDAGRRGGIR